MCHKKAPAENDRDRAKKQGGILTPIKNVNTEVIKNQRANSGTAKILDNPPTINPNSHTTSRDSKIKTTKRNAKTFKSIDMTDWSKRNSLQL